MIIKLTDNPLFVIIFKSRCTFLLRTKLFCLYSTHIHSSSTPYFYFGGLWYTTSTDTTTVLPTRTLGSKKQDAHTQLVLLSNKLLLFTMSVNDLLAYSSRINLIPVAIRSIRTRNYMMNRVTTMFDEWFLRILFMEYYNSSTTSPTVPAIKLSPVHGFNSVSVRFLNRSQT